MYHTDLHNALSAIHPITESAWNALEDMLDEIVLEQNEYLLRRGQRAHRCYWLQEGVVRVFFEYEANEYNKTFFLPGMFPTALTALLNNTPSEINFQALTPSKLLSFPYHGFRDLFEEHRCLEKLFLRILEYQWTKKERHDIRMVTQDATANYLTFRKEHPGLEALIPQYHIASYLGVTPIQLSRIRAKLVGKG